MYSKLYILFTLLISTAFANSPQNPEQHWSFELKELILKAQEDADSDEEYQEKLAILRKAYSIEALALKEDMEVLEDCLLVAVEVLTINNRLKYIIRIIKIYIEMKKKENPEEAHKWDMRNFLVISQILSASNSSNKKLVESIDDLAKKVKKLIATYEEELKKIEKDDKEFDGEFTVFIEPAKKIIESYKKTNENLTAISQKLKEAESSFLAQGRRLQRYLTLCTKMNVKIAEMIEEVTGEMLAEVERLIKNVEP